MRRQAQQPVRDIYMKKDRWSITIFPTDSFAQDAGMSLYDFEVYVYSACFADEEDPPENGIKLQETGELIRSMEGGRRKNCGTVTILECRLKEELSITATDS
jgi:aminopeptidase